MELPRQNGFVSLETSEKLLRAISPEYPDVKTVLSGTAPGTRWRGLSRSEQLVMFRITADTCHSFTRSSYYGGCKS